MMPREDESSNAGFTSSQMSELTQIHRSKTADPVDLTAQPITSEEAKSRSYDKNNKTRSIRDLTIPTRIDEMKQEEDSSFESEEYEREIESKPS